jgi:hypothetical protein
MSIILTLDTNALDKLFSEEGDARLMLRQAVIAELVKRVFPKNVNPEIRKEIEAQLQALRPEILEIVRDEKTVNRAVDDAVRNMKSLLRSSAASNVQGSSDLVREIDERIATFVKDRVEQRIGGTQKLVDDAVDRTEQRIKNNMDRWIDERVNVRIQAEVDARIERMRSAL